MKFPDNNGGTQPGKVMILRPDWYQVVLSIMFMVIFTATVEPAGIKTAHEQIVGVYTLARYSAHGDKPTGRLSYDASGRMWVMLLPPGRDPISRSSTPEEYRKTMRGVVAYFGTYDIDESTGRIIHHVEAASNPAWIGNDFVRWYRFTGPDLLLSLNADFTDSLMWERLPESAPVEHRDE